MEIKEYTPTKAVVEQAKMITDFLTNHYELTSFVEFDTDEDNRGVMDIYLYKNPKLELADQEHYWMPLSFDRKHIYKEMDFTEKLTEKFLKQPTLGGLPTSHLIRMSKVNKKKLEDNRETWKRLLTELFGFMLNRYEEGIYLDDFIALKKSQLDKENMSLNRIMYTLEVLKEDGVLNFIKVGEEYKIIQPKKTPCKLLKP